MATIVPVVFAVLAASPTAGQEPPDTSAVDTPVADSLAADSLEVDSLPPPPVMPTLPDPVPAGLAAGIWEWDREELLAARGQTLWELLTEIPGLLGVRGGDFGSAVTVFPVGYAGGALRLYYDGVEHLPLEGSVPDLARVSLAGIERVRVVRRATGVEVNLFRLAHSDPRAMSLIEAGTGDLDTNLMRATFSLPRAFGGKAALAVERLDTQSQDAPGATMGGWLRYSLHRGDRGGIRFETRRMTGQRTVLTPSPTKVNRSDWTLQGNWSLSEAAVAEAWATGASIAVGDSTEVFPFAPESRGQYGAQLSLGRGPLWARTAARFNSGAGVADRELSVEASVTGGRGGASGRAWRESWDARAGTGYDFAAWLTPVSYASFFVERGSGSRSVPFLNPPVPEEAEDSVSNPVPEPDTVEADPPPESRFTHRSGTRVGARLRWRAVEFSGARLSAQADSVWPTQLLFDRDGFVLPQPRRRGWEFTGRIPLRPTGLFFVGEVQFWEPQDSMSLYFPDHIYRGSLSFHRIFRASGNFELWVDLGAQGRSSMNVPLPTEAEPSEEDEDETIEPGTLVPSMVPFYQSWYFRLQMRFLTLNIFATIDNLTLRRNNQDVPGILLPGTRSIYGVRWTFWN
ncbi:MAG: Plug domain-containing protein [Gemmatimonadota bacterium]|nr:Plug domain-containing protein [Gemmatimonadota bacterium]